MRSLTLMSARLVFALAVSSFLYSLSYALTVFTLDPEEESGILPLSYSSSYSYSSLSLSPSPSFPSSHLNLLTPLPPPPFPPLLLLPFPYPSFLF